MTTFPELPNLKPGGMSGSRRLWTLLEPMLLPTGEIVEAGFVTDGLSVPRPAHTYLAPTGRGFAAAIAHDWRYRNSTESRLRVDRRFCSELHATGEVSRIDSVIIYRAVRTGGRDTWNLYREAQPTPRNHRPRRRR